MATYQAIIPERIKPFAKETKRIDFLFNCLNYVLTGFWIIQWGGYFFPGQDTSKFFQAIIPFLIPLGVICVIIAQILLIQNIVEKIDYKIRKRKTKKRLDLLSIEGRIQAYEHDRAILLAEMEEKESKLKEFYDGWFDFIGKSIELAKEKK